MMIHNRAQLNLCCWNWRSGLIDNNARNMAKMHRLLVDNQELSFGLKSRAQK